MDTDDVLSIPIQTRLSMNILTITTLYPNAIQPRHGIFVRNRFLAMDRLAGFNRKVIAPVPYCPFVSIVSSRYKLFEQVPDYETIDDIDVHHPKYFTLPGFSPFDNASSMAKAAHKTIDSVYKNVAQFDIVDGQYLYPDGVAAYKVAKQYNKPLVLTARGSDVNYWMTIEKSRNEILEAIEYSSGIICVSNALKDALIEYGVEAKKITVIVNGVDPEIFNSNVEANPLREEYFLSVGNLVLLKGHHLILDALAEIPNKRLIIVGNGEQRVTLRNQTEDLGLSSRVQFIKHLSQKKLAELYAGAKATILMSEMEGMPNVVLESLATGTPVIAPSVGGISEVVNESNGILLSNRDEYELMDALENLDELEFDRKAISETVSQYRWSDVAVKQYDLYKSII